MEGSSFYVPSTSKVTGSNQYSSLMAEAENRTTHQTCWMIRCHYEYSGVFMVAVQYQVVVMECNRYLK